MKKKAQGNPNFKELEAYFKSLALPQKKQFIQNLRQKISGQKDSKYRDFLAKCMKEYNEEVRKANKETKEKAESSITDAVFAQALAAMLSPQGPSQKAVAAKLVGRWQREDGKGTFYFDFKTDGSFETNEASGSKTLTGRYSAGLDGVLLLEPAEELGIKNIMMTSGSLVVEFLGGFTFEYRIMGNCAQHKDSKV